MFSVDIRNYQSIEHLSVVIDGFTVLVGRSNIGKSAIIRAMKSALTNAAGTAFVRHDATCTRRLKGSKNCRCETSVHIKGEGFDLLWRKGDSTNCYEFNGKLYDAVDRGVPDFLKQAGFDPLKVGDHFETLQVADQFEPIFLLKESGGSAAEVLSDVARLDAINDAMRIAEKDRKEAASTRKVREKDVIELDVSLSKFETLPDVTKAAARVQASLKQIEDLASKLARLDRYISAVADIATRVKALSAVSDILVPDSTKLKTQMSAVESMARYQVQFAIKSASVENLIGVDTLVPPTLNACLDAQKTFNVIDSWLARVRSVKATYANLNTVTTVDIPAVQEVLTKGTHATQLIRLGVKHAKLMDAIQALEQSYRLAQGAEDSVRDEIAELGVCPTCVLPIASRAHREATHG